MTRRRARTAGLPAVVLAGLVLGPRAGTLHAQQAEEPIVIDHFTSLHFSAMAQPIYFLPNIESKALLAGEQLNRQVLRAHGLDEVFADVRTAGEVAVMEWRSKGPGDKSGVLLTYLKECPTRDIPQHWGYYPDHQNWEPLAAGLPTWIGWNPDQPPTPEDLRRRSLVPGYHYVLGDGNPWVVPIVRRPDDSTNLPRRMFIAGEPMKPATKTVAGRS